MTFCLNNGGSCLEAKICYINAILQLLHSIAMIQNLVKRKGQPEAGTPVLDELSLIFNYEGSVTTTGPLRQILGQDKSGTRVCAPR